MVSKADFVWCIITYRFIKSSKELDVRLKTLRGLLKSFVVCGGEGMEVREGDRERKRERLMRKSRGNDRKTKDEEVKVWNFTFTFWSHS